MDDEVRFYFDEHVDPAVAVGLRRFGIDVLTAGEAGRLGRADPDQLAFATAERRVMVTFDSDYIDMHNAGESHAGIAVGRDKHSIGYLVAALRLIHGVFTADDMTNRLEYL